MTPKSLLADLKQKAMAATKGPWYFRDKQYEEECGVMGGIHASVMAEDEDGGFDLLEDTSLADLKYIASLPPELIIALVDVAMAAKRVMDDLEVHGAEIVPHLIDSDDNDGQRLRDALSTLATISEETSA